MRTDMVSAAGSGFDRREGRVMGRVLARVSLETDISVARIEQAAELQVGRVQAVAYVGKKAMQEVALVSQLEAQLATLVPMATGRLQAIGDMVALEAADVLSQTVRKVSR
jgi:hypothetical protein